MKQFLYIVIGLVVLIGVGFAISKIPSTPGQYDEFATCIDNSGATFWGAFWCPHCQEQKALFGKSVKLLPYEECSTPDGKGQTKICADAGVTSYPSWDFPGQERVVGVLSLADLSEKTNCPLPDLKQ